MRFFQIHGCVSSTGQTHDRMQRASSVGATSLMYIMQNSVCPPCGGGTLKCSCRKELGDQLQLVRSMLSEIAERSDTCHTMTDVTTIGDLRCECACGVQLVPETSAALFIKRTRPRTVAVRTRIPVRSNLEPCMYGCGTPYNACAWYWTPQRRSPPATS